MKNRVKPTKKQILAVDGIMEGKSGRRAMMDAGYSKKTSGNPKSKLVELRGVQTYLSKFDEASKRKFKMGLGDKLIDTYLDGLEASKPLGKSGNDYPDWPTRSIYANKLSEIMGWHKGEQLQKEEYYQYNYFNVSEEERNRMNQKLKEVLREVYKES